MRRSVTVAIFLAQASLSSTGFGASAAASRGRSYSLPWEIMVAKVRELAMGKVSGDYEIVAEGHVVPLLKDYLGKSANSDIDARLDRVKLNIF